MATPIEQAPPRIRAAAAAHAADRDQQRAEAAALLERHRAGEPDIAVGVEELLAILGLDQDRRVPHRRYSLVRLAQFYGTLTP